MQKRHPIFYLIPALLWSGIIFTACFLPGSDLPHDDFFDKIHLDKIVHASMYFIFFFLLLHAMKTQVWKRRSKLLLAAAICMAQGILIEFVQGSSLVQGRSFEWADIVANCFGILLGFFFFRFLRPRQFL